MLFEIVVRALRRELLHPLWNKGTAYLINQTLRRDLAPPKVAAAALPL